MRLLDGETAEFDVPQKHDSKLSNAAVVVAQQFGTDFRLKRDLLTRLNVDLAVSSVWRKGTEKGLFPEMPLCNSHGTMDMRSRLEKYLRDLVRM